MRQLRFYMESDGTWFVDLPDWEGSKDDLAMVEGADTMLDMIAEGGSETTLYISETAFNNSEELIFIEMAIELGNGAYYTIPTYQGVEINHKAWLCDVMLHVFNNRFPPKLFFSKIN